MHKIFVYGTLKTGFCRNHCITQGKFVSEAITATKYKLFSCGTYPALIESPDGIAIKGEIWEINDEILENLDLIEGCDIGLYNRKGIEVVGFQDVQSYFYLRAVSELEDIGDEWLRT